MRGLAVVELGLYLLETGPDGREQRSRKGDVHSGAKITHVLGVARGMRF